MLRVVKLEPTRLSVQVAEAKRVLLQSGQLQGQEDGPVAGQLSGLAISS